MKIVHVAGARPNFVKIASILRASASTFENVLVHTGQHYSANMSDVFFDELEIPRPHVNLDVGSGSHARQTAEIMQRIEPVLLELRPGAVVVVGDVNSTVACALVAAKLGITVVHVEAGLRSFDRTMPEEINRVVTDSISDLLFVSEPAGIQNLTKEGVASERIHFVGNVMIDTLLRNRSKAEGSRILIQLSLDEGNYAVLTLHRPSNVDNPEVLKRLLDVLGDIQRELPIVFPVHPRTSQMLHAGDFGSRIREMQNLRMIDPVGYLDFVKLLKSARCVFTDSGGIQEETTALGVPCLTLRENTERPITLTHGTNRLVGTSPERIISEFKSLEARPPQSLRPDLWDGNASERIVAVLKQVL